MATYRQKSGRLEVGVCVAGVRKSKMFDLKRQAVVWAAEQELALRSPDEVANIPLLDVFRRYADEVSVKKRGVRVDSLRVAALMRDAVFSRLSLADVTELHLAMYRERRF